MNFYSKKKRKTIDNLLAFLEGGGDVFMITIFTRILVFDGRKMNIKKELEIVVRKVMKFFF